MNADLIVTNGTVLTMDAAHPRAEAVAVAAGKVVAVGSRAEVEALKGPKTQVIDVGGRSVLPGFVESHMHLGLGGAELPHLHLDTLHGEEVLRAAYAGYAAARPGMGFLMAEGADYHILDREITRQDLDAFTGDRPFAIRAMDHHTVWANTAALQAAGLLHGKAMPHGHDVVMGPDGLASGELREFAAFAPILDLAGIGRINLGIATGAEPAVPPSAAERAVDKGHIARGLAHAAAQGITSIVNMDGNRYTLDLLAEMQREGRLTARVVVPFHFKPDMPLTELERASAMTRDYHSDWLRSGFVKMFMDGVVDSRTAYMLQDYPGTTGRASPLFAPEWFSQVCVEIDRRGLQIAVHAIGDGAVQVTIDGYEAAQKANGKRDSRHRIEHIELIDRADVPRLGALGITASVQPPHPPGAMDFPLATMETVFHRDRWRDAYMWKSLQDQGAPMAYASDWPVTDISVMRGLQAALTRVPFGPDCADERLSREKSLLAYTAWGAWAGHLEDVTGMLRVGLAGDLVVIDGDIEAIPAEILGATGIALTVAGGKVTHQAIGVRDVGRATH
jgi:hypothetical protein